MLQSYFVKVCTNINDSSNLLFSSVRDRAVVTCKEQESGIYFRNVSNIKLEDIEFKHCGITNSAHSRSFTTTKQPCNSDSISKYP